MSYNLTPRQVQLTPSTTASAVVSAVFEMYDEKIDPNQYEDRLAFIGKDGQLTIEFVDIQTKETHYVFKDRYTQERLADDTLEFMNPREFIFPEVTKNFGILINTETELEFLKNVRKDVRYNSSLPGKGYARELARLLNRYNIGNGWSSNPDGGNTTAYFIVRYYGSGANAPDVYNFNRDAKVLVVVELLLHGEYKTHALIVG